MTVNARRDRRGRLIQTVITLLMLVLGVGFLVWLVLQSSACGDGICVGGEDLRTCPTDCAALAAIEPVSEPAEPAPERERAPEPVAVAPPPAAPKSPPSAPRPAPKPMKRPATEPPERPEGRCRDPRFLKVANDVVKECKTACRKEKNPVVALPWEAFVELFGKPDDPGVASHFSIFGCNAYAGRACRGFDSSIADPGECPSGARGASCRRYATPLQDELVAFLDRNRDARTVVLLGTASRVGNSAGVMSDRNARLAEDRALAVQEVINTYRRRHGLADMRVYAVVLDNAKHDYYRSPEFRRIIGAQLSKVGGRDRGFVPTTGNAVNRSVLVIAIKCSLDP